MSLRQAFQENAWARNNILVAVAGGETDGTSGVRAGAEQTLRAELRKTAESFSPAVLRSGVLACGAV